MEAHNIFIYAFPLMLSNVTNAGPAADIGPVITIDKRTEFLEFKGARYYVQQVSSPQPSSLDSGFESLISSDSISTNISINTERLFSLYKVNVFAQFKTIKNNYLDVPILKWHCSTNTQRDAYVINESVLCRFYAAKSYHVATASSIVDETNSNLFVAYFENNNEQRPSDDQDLRYCVRLVDVGKLKWSKLEGSQVKTNRQGIIVNTLIPVEIPTKNEADKPVSVPITNAEPLYLYLSIFRFLKVANRLNLL